MYKNILSFIIQHHYFLIQCYIPSTLMHPPMSLDGREIQVPATRATSSRVSQFKIYSVLIYYAATTRSAEHQAHFAASSGNVSAALRIILHTCRRTAPFNYSPPRGALLKEKSSYFTRKNDVRVSLVTSSLEWEIMIDFHDTTPANNRIKDIVTLRKPRDFLAVVRFRLAMSRFQICTLSAHARHVPRSCTLARVPRHVYI